jgi:hypothetical protein
MLMLALAKARAKAVSVERVSKKMPKLTQRGNFKYPCRPLTFEKARDRTG